MSTLLHQLFLRQTCLASHCRPNRGREGAVRTHRNVGNSSSDAPEPDAASRGFIPAREAFETKYHNLIVQSSAALLPSTFSSYRQPIVIFVTGGLGAPFSSPPAAASLPVSPCWIVLDDRYGVKNPSGRGFFQKFMLGYKTDHLLWGKEAAEHSGQE